MKKEFTHTFRLSLGETSNLRHACNKTGAKLFMEDAGHSEQYIWTGTPEQWAVAFEHVKGRQETARGAQKRVLNSLARIVKHGMQTEKEFKAEQAAEQAERKRRREERRRKHEAAK